MPNAKSRRSAKSRPPEKNAPTTWLLLRGLGREAGHWGDFPDLLTEAGLRVFLLDLPGTGTRRDRHSPLSIDGITDDLRRRWLQKREAEKIKGPVGLLAISLGGMAALNWVSRYGGDFSQLVLVNSSSSLSPFYRRLRPSAIFEALLVALTSSRTSRVERLYERVCNSDEHREAILSLWARLERERPLRIGELLRQIIAAARFRPRYRPTVPVQVLASSRDRLVHPGCSRDLADYCRGPLRFHPWAGHDLPLDDGPWLREQLLDLMRDNLSG